MLVHDDLLDDRLALPDGGARVFRGLVVQLHHVCVRDGGRRRLGERRECFKRMPVAELQPRTVVKG